MIVALLHFRIDACYLNRSIRFFDAFAVQRHGTGKIFESPFYVIDSEMPHRERDAGVSGIDNALQVAVVVHHPVAAQIIVAVQRHILGGKRQLLRRASGAMGLAAPPAQVPASGRAISPSTRPEPTRCAGSEASA